MEILTKPENETGAAIHLYMSIFLLFFHLDYTRRSKEYKTGKKIESFSPIETYVFYLTMQVETRILEIYFPILVPTMKSTLHAHIEHYPSATTSSSAYVFAAGVRPSRANSICNQ